MLPLIPMYLHRWFGRLLIYQIASSASFRYETTAPYQAEDQTSNSAARWLHFMVPSLCVSERDQSCCNSLNNAEIKVNQLPRLFVRRVEQANHQVLQA